MIRPFPFSDRIRHGLARFGGALGGNVALLFALALPPLAVATVGGIQLSYVMSVRSTSQDVADAAALAGAQQMALSPVGAADRAKSWAQTQLANKASSSTFSVAANLVDQHTLLVTVDAYTPSFFGDMLPKGGFKSHAEATAQQQALAPLCVLVDGGGSDYLKVAAASRISGSCLVHANGDIQMDPLASIAASRVETGGTVTGVPLRVTPTAQTGAVQVGDPFASLPLSDFSGSCGGATQNYGSNTTKTFAAGLHDGKISIGSNSTITFAPGEHYFCKDFTIGDNSDIYGTDVVLIFDKSAKFDLKNTGTVTLSGRQSGSFAGFVVIAARNNTNSFTIPTDPITKITGAIYSPNAQLILNGSKQAAQASDWTVVAAKSLLTTGSANLQINTNYAGSSVQVPIGVGNRASAGSPIRLVH